MFFSIFERKLKPMKIPSTQITVVIEKLLRKAISPKEFQTLSAPMHRSAEVFET
jgi:hypothetical protein